jgi:hypothetical protein
LTTNSSAIAQNLLAQRQFWQSELKDSRIEKGAEVEPRYLGCYKALQTLDINGGARTSPLGTRLAVLLFLETFPFHLLRTQ